MFRVHVLGKDGKISETIHETLDAVSDHIKDARAQGLEAWQIDGHDSRIPDPPTNGRKPRKV